MTISLGLSNKLIRGLLTGTLGGILALIIWVCGLIDAWEVKSWDWRVALMAKPGKATSNICLILLDQKSLDWAKEVNALTWPWPREAYGAIVNYCKRNGAKAVAFDVLFTDPSKYGVDDDAAFGQAVAAFGHVALAAALSNNSGNNSHWPATVPLPSFEVKKTLLARFEGMPNHPYPLKIWHARPLFCRMSACILILMEFSEKLIC